MSNTEIINNWEQLPVKALLSVLPSLGFPLCQVCPGYAPCQAQGSVVVPLTYFGTFTLEPYILYSHAFNHQYSGADQRDQQFSEIPSQAISATHSCLWIVFLPSPFWDSSELHLSIPSLCPSLVTQGSQVDIMSFTLYVPSHAQITVLESLMTIFWTTHSLQFLLFQYENMFCRRANYTFYLCVPKYEILCKCL